MTTTTIKAEMKKLDDWRVEAEYAALQMFKGDLLQDAYVRISNRFQEKLHRLKLSVIHGG